jgi:hypothetical protein
LFIFIGVVIVVAIAAILTILHKEQKVESLILDKTNVSLGIHETDRLTVSVKPEDAQPILIWESSDENIVKEVARAKEQGVQNAEQLFMKMWIFIHGAGCMAVTGDYDLEEADSIAMLTSAYEAFRQA